MQMDYVSGSDRIHSDSDLHMDSDMHFEVNSDGDIHPWESNEVNSAEVNSAEVNSAEVNSDGDSDIHPWDSASQGTVGNCWGNLQFLIFLENFLRNRILRILMGNLGFF